MALLDEIKSLRASDIRGIVQLVTQAATGVSRISEGVHQAVWGTMGVSGGPEPGQTGGLTGLVYKGINTTTRMVGAGLDVGLAGLQALFDTQGASPAESLQRQAIVSALNGVIGDRLAAESNHFAIPMTLRYQGADLGLNNMSSMPEASGKVLLMIHGLCMNDLQSNALHRGNEVEHGQSLKTALGYTPVYLRYNTGKHISSNGKELAQQLEKLMLSWPLPIEELSVVAHSMGGLLIRSAVHYANSQEMNWPGHLKNIVFLGTPHHGAPLEQAGNWLDAILGVSSFSKPFSSLSQLRSPGITDLRYGFVLDEDWQGTDRFQLSTEHHQTLALPKDVFCYAVAACKAQRQGTLANRLVGDGLVPLNSALGQHEELARCLGFAADHKQVYHDMGHLALLNSKEVSSQMIEWLSSPIPSTQQVLKLDTSWVGSKTKQE